MKRDAKVDLEATLASEAFLRDPYPTLRLLREEAPVYWSESIGGWLITRYDDVVVTFRDVDHFSSEGRGAKAIEYLPAETRASFKAFENHFRTKGLINSDPPDHTRLRALVSARFTPRAIELLRPRIQATVDGLLDDTRASGSMDVIADLAIPLPAIVIAEVFGVPPEDTGLFLAWADDILISFGVNKPAVEKLRRTQDAIVALRAYVSRLIELRRSDPKDDLLSGLVAAEAGGDRLSEAELLNTSLTFLVAGHETTRSLIGNGLYLLLSEPERWRQLRADPALLKPAIEETLRYESPVSRQARLLKADANLGGQSLRQGQVVFQMLNAANRDPAHFANPGEFDLGRADNRHLAFGNGIHFCLGAPLARLEGAIAFASLIERMPALRLVGAEPDWDIGKGNARVLRSLPVAF